MCGIFGYIGAKNGASVCLNGLQLLEYRGYDSAGIAGITSDSLKTIKSVGKVASLASEVTKNPLPMHATIAHTRWATHGKPSKENAHPQVDESGKIAVVHNGIIENHYTLKTMLKTKGVSFTSDTDTEVIAKLIEYHYSGDLSFALRETLKVLKGFWALAVLHEDHPDEIVVACQENPLAIGINKQKNETFISSDASAFTEEGIEVLFLEDGDIATVTSSNITFFDLQNVVRKRTAKTLPITHSSFSKNGFAHYMLKEIYEQPDTIRQAMQGRFDEENGSASFEGMAFSDDELKNFTQVLILACGTSYHAGLIAASWIEERVKIPARAEIASEFRYKSTVLSEGTLVIAISQSGETFDTLASVREVKQRKAPVLAICNVPTSTLAREADAAIFLRAGPEISVCSTKAFSGQLAVLSLFSLKMARLRSFSLAEGKALLAEMEKLPVIIDKILRSTKEIEKTAKKYASFSHAFFLGRHYMHITGLEAALKLKETSYINAVGYPAGEMKHGPIALLDPSLAVIGLCGDSRTIDKMTSNLMEVKAREAPLLAFAPDGSEEIASIADDVVFLPKASDEIACFIYSVATQLFAYYTSLERGTEIDQPRNLAKSVTVE